MPISRKQFELGIVDTEVEKWARRIHISLTEHRDEAFTRGELREQFGLRADGWDTTTEAFDVALYKLVELKAIDERSIQGKTYYSYGSKTLPS